MIKVNLDLAEVSEVRGILKARIEFCYERRVSVTNQETRDYWCRQEIIAKELLEKFNSELEVM